MLVAVRRSLVDCPSAAGLGAFEHSLRRFESSQALPTTLQDDVAHGFALALRLEGDRPVLLARHLHLNGPVAENSRHRRHSARTPPTPLTKGGIIFWPTK